MFGDDRPCWCMIPALKDLARPSCGDSPLAKLSPSNEVMIIMCMSSKADKLCNSKHMVKVSFVRLYVSFVQLFLSNDMVYAWVWHRLVSARPSLNDPIKHGGMENADIFNV